MWESTKRAVYLFLLSLAVKSENTVGIENPMNIDLSDNDTRYINVSTDNDSFGNLNESWAENSLENLLNGKDKGYNKDYSVNFNMHPIIESVSLLTDNTKDYLDQLSYLVYDVKLVRKSKTHITELKKYLGFSLVLLACFLMAIWAGSTMFTRILSKDKGEPLAESEEIIYQREIASIEEFLDGKVQTFNDGKGALSNLEVMRDLCTNGEEKNLFSELIEVVQFRLDFEEAQKNSNAYELENISYEKLKAHFSILEKSFQKAEELIKMISQKNTFFNKKVNFLRNELMSVSCQNVVTWLDNQKHLLNANKSRQEGSRENAESNHIKRWMQNVNTNDIFTAVRVLANEERRFHDCRYFLPRYIHQIQKDVKCPVWGLFYALTGTKTASPYFYTEAENVSEAAEARRKERYRIAFMHNILGFHSDAKSGRITSHAERLNKYMESFEKDAKDWAPVIRESSELFLRKLEMRSLLGVQDRMVMEAKGNHLENAEKWIIVRKQSTMQIRNKLISITETFNTELTKGTFTIEDSVVWNIEIMKKSIKHLEKELVVYESMMNTLKSATALEALEPDKPIIPQIAKLYSTSTAVLADNKDFFPSEEMKVNYEQCVIEGEGFLSISSITE